MCGPEHFLPFIIVVMMMMVNPCPVNSKNFHPKAKLRERPRPKERPVDQKLNMSKVGPDPGGEPDLRNDPRVHPRLSHPLKGALLVHNPEIDSFHALYQSPPSKAFQESLSKLNINERTKTFITHCMQAQIEQQTKRTTRKHDRYKTAFTKVPRWGKSGVVNNKIEADEDNFKVYRCTTVIHDHKISEILNLLLSVPNSPLTSQPTHDYIWRHVLTRDNGMQYPEICLVEGLTVDANIELEILTRSFHAVLGGIHCVLTVPSRVV